MSADYWSLTQRTQWQMKKEELAELRRRLVGLEKKMAQSGLIKDYAGVVYDINMRIYLHTMVVKLGRRLNVRQIALLTAEVYISRFLTRVSLKEINVYLLVATSLYVACKIEECPQHIRQVVTEARLLWPEYIPHDGSKLAEFEFYLIEELDMCLVVHHPYRALLQVRDFLTTQPSFGILLTAEELQHLWLLINDLYVTDLHLVFPPHVVAFSALYLTLVLQKHLGTLRAPSTVPDLHIEDLIALDGSSSGLLGQVDLATKIDRFMHFFNYSHVNLDEVAEAMQDMIALYISWDRYSEAHVRKALHGMLLKR